MKEIPYEPKAYYIFNRGYNDFKSLYHIHLVEAKFVVRAKKNMKFMTFKWKRKFPPIRDSCKYVVYKDKKEFTADMKNIYNAPNKEVAAAELDNLERKWGGKYPYAILSWRNNWDDQTVFFQFPLEIRKIIYTTNLIENLNGKIRKYTKSKLSFPSDDAVKKTVYLSLMEIEKEWTQPIHNWGLIMNQFMLIFENRIQI